MSGTAGDARGGTRHREAQFLDAYLRHRLGAELDRHERARAVHSAARVWTVSLSAALLTGAAVLGAAGVADAARRPVWGFAATLCAALASAVAGYEAVFGFQRLGREHGEAVSSLHLLRAHGPTPDDLDEGDDRLPGFVADVESVLRRGVVVTAAAPPLLPDAPEEAPAAEPVGGAAPEEPAWPEPERDSGPAESADPADPADPADEDEDVPADSVRRA
ncbi:SLATT domain-containing protein [Umezawaea beigongshangensis]|uniref:SLATT domain-containing protein n=1 Tax=Umezawaea beigongshangensis TaxID=2780383 RepID=UPI0018F18980|nr:SLATT domain-containing protein [Umezawaea beigongshangensis]